MAFVYGVLFTVINSKQKKLLVKVRKLKAMPQNEAAPAAIRRHATIALEAWRNRANIDRAIGRYLG